MPTPTWSARLTLEHAEMPRAAILRLKRTYAITKRGLERTDPIALFHDVHDASLKPRWRPGTDYWPPKTHTDFVVRGSAHAPHGRPATEMWVSARIEDVQRTVKVFGARSASRAGDGAKSGVRFSDPEPFEVLPMTFHQAYGGWDKRVRSPGEPKLEQFIATSFAADHPGMYPRNPFGMGYVVGSMPKDDEVLLPHLEDPGQLLTEDTLLAPSGARWHEQPLPWCLDWTHTIMFPRPVLFDDGADAWFPGPEDESLPEVARGYLRAGYRTNRKGLDPRFYQEASHGLVLPQLKGGESVSVSGMTPDRESVSFALPPPPSIAVKSELESTTTLPALQSVFVEATEGRVSTTYAQRIELGRVFLHGVHRRVPLDVKVDAELSLEVEMPPTLDDQMGGLKPVGGVAPPRTIKAPRA